MDAKRTAKEIYDILGGKENIISNAVCMTRLRVKVREDADVEKLKKVDGVLNVVEAETLQIVLGPGKVNSVGEEFSKLTGMPLGFSDNNVEDVAKENKKANKQKHNGPVQRFLQKIANIFVPLLPGIIAAFNDKKCLQYSMVVCRYKKYRICYVWISCNIRRNERCKGIWRNCSTWWNYGIDFCCESCTSSSS